jgi:hypothetical protein
MSDILSLGKQRHLILGSPITFYRWIAIYILCVGCGIHFKSEPRALFASQKYYSQVKLFHNRNTIAHQLVAHVL